MCYSTNSCEDHQDLLYRHFFYPYILATLQDQVSLEWWNIHVSVWWVPVPYWLLQLEDAWLHWKNGHSLQNSEPDDFVGFLFKEADEILNFWWIHKVVWQRTYLLDNPKRYCIRWSCYTMFLESVGATVPVYLLLQLLFLLLCWCKLFSWCRKNNIINVIIGRLKAACNRPLYSRQTDINGSLISTELVICVTCLIISCQNGCCEKDK